MAAGPGGGGCACRGPWGRGCPVRGLLSGALLLLASGLRRGAAELTDGNNEHLKREHSLTKPYQGVGSSSMPLWDFQGSTMLTSQYVRLTPDERSKEGSIWNRVPCFLKDWELHVHFKIHGAGKKNLHGDGFALWYTRERLVPGPVFGSKDNFHGLAIFLDTYPNDEATERVFPYISAMVNNGSLAYDHSKDGRWTELAGCTADLRNQNHDTFLAVRYSRGRLTGSEHKAKLTHLPTSAVIPFLDGIIVCLSAAQRGTEKGHTLLPVPQCCSHLSPSTGLQGILGPSVVQVQQ
ncbi:hypothetical protein KIL84_016268 [Mauremys mutica]|uniref:L-type lectin-like domain-containing protein n=1 Tax=Mauremys mutica TaxID=74926 RepID=A0A9D3WU65_9SAUR|nr:hypothetical protein KIL84_016268 [Mauremys mutica]